MPSYIITTHKAGRGTGLGGPGNDMPEQTRHAAATLDEAAEHAYFLIDDALAALRTDRIVNLSAEMVRASDAYALPDTGGTIGPLPDGTVIEVRPVD